MAESFREYVETLGANERGIIALDDMSSEQSRALLTRVHEFFNLAKENANAQQKGWEDSVNRNSELGYGLMADAKFHDTPRTMQSHANVTALQGSSFITLYIPRQNHRCALLN